MNRLKLIEKIEKLREQMHQYLMINNYNVNEMVLQISQKLDVTLNEYHELEQNKVKFSADRVYDSAQRAT